MMQKCTNCGSTIDTANREICPICGSKITTMDQVDKWVKSIEQGEDSLVASVLKFIAWIYMVISVILGFYVLIAYSSTETITGTKTVSGMTIVAGIVIILQGLIIGLLGIAVSYILNDIQFLRNRKH